MEENFKRENRLDSLRGIAALCVAAGHCIVAMSLNPQYANTFKTLNYNSKTEVMLRLLHILFNAEASVIVFFVLSGYVLTKSLSKINGNYLSEFVCYIFKRIYRIFPTVIFSFIPLAYFIDKSAWEYVKNMFLSEITINGVTWTLKVEILASILVFFIFVISKKARYLQIPLFLILMFLFFSNYNQMYFKHLPAFFLGCYVNKIKEFFVNIKNQKYIVPIAIFFLITSDFIFGYKKDATIIIQTICSTVLIACIYSSRLLIFLDYKIFRYIGKISFSFYIYNSLGGYITLKMCENLGIQLRSANQVIDSLRYFIISTLITMIVATISYYLIEEPSIIAAQNMVKIIKEKINKIKCI